MPTSYPPLNLDSLPFDVFYQIATLLDDRDCIHLSRTNCAIHALMDSDLIARKTVESVLAHSKEGRAALAAQSGYRKAVGRRFDIHEAVATAAPYAVAVLAYAADFLYHQGILCYRVGHEIRVLNVHRGARQERVLNLYEVIPRLDGGPPAGSFDLASPDPAERVELVHYSEGILVFRLQGIGAQDDLLIAIDMALRQSRRRRLLLQKSIPAEAAIFVRHSRSYIWYGIFTAALGSQGAWQCYGMDLATDETIEFLLDRVVDEDIGQTLCFETYQDHLYAVSTQVTSDDDERFSSFYHWFCYAPRQKGRKWSGRLWRREHCEGPINEMWTDLAIRTDETTGRPVIIECRREWRDGKSENHRTTYIEPLSTPAEMLAAHPEGDVKSPARSASVFDDDEADSNTKDPEIDQAYDHRPEKRVRRNYHAEYELSDDPQQRQEFIAARTKHRSYHLAAATFVDLVNDPAPQADGVRVRDRLRLRTVSRKRKCPIDEQGIAGEPGLLFRPTQTDADGRPVEGAEERFDSRGVHLWPREDAPAELHHLLCPDPHSGIVDAISDERTLVYSVTSAGLPPSHRALILISFDPALHFPTLSSVQTLKTSATPQSIFPVVLPKPTTSRGGLIKEAVPLYQAIRRGYWLR
ncbi:uncharacterized protein N7482_009983 [Penicillium canariense]|uniref:F-box domain-containing protein n=1 Tax=Penicillium canariense TaxID=189055 RepID=A0A9W9HRX1_9EURO|nr:uncharacterized protein N7482_009983 [Penicillium canariense]KAJ5153505.1 hypothetical protein N7482_009983 [Penicillium canariense]